MADHEQIKVFIKQIAEADEIIFIQTNKNRATRYQLGLTLRDCEDIVRRLGVHDYHRGPLGDHNPNKEGMVWIFKTFYESEILYIKLKEIEVVENKQVMKCLSCHIDNIEV